MRLVELVVEQETDKDKIKKVRLLGIVLVSLRVFSLVNFVS